MAITGERCDEIGGNGGTVFTSVMVRYVAGVMCRERERLARIFEADGRPDLAQKIRSGDQDDQVFRWASPDAKLDAPLAPRKSQGGE